MPYKSSKKATMLISTAEKPRSGTRIRSFSSSLSMGVILVHSCFMATQAKQGGHARGPCKGPTALKRSGSRPDRLIICTRLKPIRFGRVALDLDPVCLGRFGRVRARCLGRFGRVRARRLGQLGLVRARCLGRLPPGLKLDSPGRFAPVPKRSTVPDGSHQA